MLALFFNMHSIFSLAYRICSSTTRTRPRQGHRASSSWRAAIVSGSCLRRAVFCPARHRTIIQMWTRRRPTRRRSYRWGKRKICVQCVFYYNVEAICSVVLLRFGVFCALSALDPVSQQQNKVEELDGWYKNKLFLCFSFFVLRTYCFPLHQHCFQVSYRRDNQRHYELKCNNESECSAWIIAIREARWAHMSRRIYKLINFFLFLFSFFVETFHLARGRWMHKNRKQN